jgi:photosystem II stability/assembly factor-like uncharacterized protein
MKHHRLLLVTLTLFFSATCAFAQDPFWEYKTTIPNGYVVGMKYHNDLGIVAMGTNGKITHSTDIGENWKTLASTLSTAHDLAVDPRDRTLLYAATPEGVWLTSDGKDWDPAGLLEKDVTAIDIAVDQNILFAGTTIGAYLSTDRGVNWEEEIDALPTLKIQCVGAAANRWLFAGTASGLFIHDELDFDWFPTSIGNEDIRAIRISGQTGIGWVGSSSAVYNTTDLGVTWTKKFSTTAPVTFIWRIAPCVLVGTGSGVHFSTDEGQTWTLVNKGITLPDVTSMMTAPDQHILLATKDGKIYRSLAVIGDPMSVKDRDDESAYAIYPNPASERAILSLPKEHKITHIAIVDMLGREVMDNVVSNGMSEIALPVNSLPNGSYLVLLHSVEATIKKHLTVCKR